LQELLKRVRGTQADHDGKPLHPDARCLRKDLEQICGKVEGSFAASVMGFDGIPIETHEARPSEGIEMNILLIEYSGIISQVRQAAETLQMGKASEVSIRTEKMVAVAGR